MTAPGFRDAFARAAGRVRRALGLRRLLDGATYAAALSALVALGLGFSGGAPWAAFAVVGLGVAGAGVTARRARFGDAAVALYLDARLDSGEVITTAIGQPSGGAVAEHVASAAAEALGRGTSRAITPRVFFPVHATLPIALAVMLLSPHLVPARPHAPPKHAADTVRTPLAELRHVEEFAALTARSPEERERREALAEQARALSARTAAGVEKREALDALARLRDGVDAERAARRTSVAGRDAAASALAKRKETANAALAVRRMDLTQFDREMDRLARSLEARSRRAALAALVEARDAARAHGDGDLSDAIDEQRRLLRSRSERADAFRELSKALERALPKDRERTLATLDRETTDAALASALESALDGLSPEERERLARALAEDASHATSASPLSREELERLIKALGSGDVREPRKRALEELADGKESATSEKERALARAELSISAAERRISAGNTGPNGADGDPGSGPFGGPGSHDRGAPPLAASSFPAVVSGPVSGGVPLGAGPDLPPAIAATVPRPRALALSAAAPREIGAVEHANVPREYREQVGRYFAP